MIVTSDAVAAARLRSLRSHAASTSDLARHQSSPVDFEEYPELGYNYRMTDIQAAIGLVQMGRLESILSARAALAGRYTSALTGFEGIEPPLEPPGRRHTFQSYCVRLSERRARAEIMTELARKGIATRRGVMAIHLEPFYRRRFPELCLPHTEAAARETMLLPLYVGMTNAEQDYVVESLVAALRQ
jgi:dTDP-4-amino-4,6-dideoxygalactose transaminase